MHHPEVTECPVPTANQTILVVQGDTGYTKEKLSREAYRGPALHNTGCKALGRIRKEQDPSAQSSKLLVRF